MSRRTIAAFVAVGVLWGSAWIPTSLMSGQLPRLRAGALRFAIAAVFCALVALAARLRVREASPRKPGAILVDSLVLGAAAVGLPYALTAWSVGTVSSGAFAVLFALMPLAALLLNKNRPGAALPPLVTGVCGVAVLVAQGLSLSAGQARGAFFTACAVILGAFALNYAKRRLRPSELPASAAIQFAVAAALLGALSIVNEREPTIWSQGTSLSLLALGVAISGATLPVMYWLLTKLEAWQVAALQWSATLVAVAEAAWFVHPRMPYAMWIGAGMVIGATAWLFRAVGITEEAAVTLQITNDTLEPSTASESEVRSKVE